MWSRRDAGGSDLPPREGEVERGWELTPAHSGEPGREVVVVVAVGES
jgi:hypothetical protein